MLKGQTGVYSYYQSGSSLSIAIESISDQGIIEDSE
jgi:hypothetical protein